MIDRIKFDAGVVKYSNYPVIVEAKKIFGFEISDTGVKSIKDNTSGIKDDILALLKIHFGTTNPLKNHPFTDSKGFFIYILTWNIETEYKTDDVITEQIISKVTDNELRQFKLSKIDLFSGYKSIHWIPIVMEKNTNGTEEPKVTKWLWFFLGEIYKKPELQGLDHRSDDYWGILS